MGSHDLTLRQLSLLHPNPSLPTNPQVLPTVQNLSAAFLLGTLEAFDPTLAHIEPSAAFHSFVRLKPVPTHDSTCTSLKADPTCHAALRTFYKQRNIKWKRLRALYEGPKPDGPVLSCRDASTSDPPPTAPTTANPSITANTPLPTPHHHLPSP